MGKQSFGCACEKGGTCDVNHDPEKCACKQCNPVHLAFDGVGQFAPCGARVVMTSTTMEMVDGRYRMTQHAPPPEKLCQSTYELHRVTCVQCRRLVQKLAQDFSRAKRKKVLGW